MANIWNGASGPSALWSNAADWSAGIPQATDDVSIPAGSPLLDKTTGSTTVASITIGSGASLAIKTPGSTVTVTGDFTANGAFGIDSGAFDPGGSTLAIGGALNFNGSGMGIGNFIMYRLVNFRI